MFEMRIYYPPTSNPEEFQARYLEGHLPLVQKYANIKETRFEKAARTIMGEFPYAYVFSGTWEDKEGWKADMNSPEAADATEDAKQFAPEFTVVTFERLA